MLRMEYEIAFVITDASTTESEMSSRLAMSEARVAIIIMTLMISIVMTGGTQLGLHL